MVDSLKDPGTERAVLSTIISKGRDGLIDADSILSANDFSVGINRTIYTCISDLCKEDEVEKLDSEVIKAKAKALGFKDIFNSPKDIEYLEILCNTSGSVQNLNTLVYHVKRYSILRELHDRYKNAVDLIEKSKASDSLSDILAKVEGYVLDYIAGIDDRNSYEVLSDTILNKISELLANKPKATIGISSGYPIWDAAIGGGLRKGTVAVVGARAKCVNSYDTCLLTSDGILHPYELHDAEKSEIDFDIDYKLVDEFGEYVKPQYWWNSYLSDTIVLTTKYGYQIECTPDHPLRILDINGNFVWKDAKYITTKDVIIIRRKDNLWGSLLIDDNTAYVMGCVLGDGHITKKNQITITSMDEPIQEQAVIYANKYENTLSSYTKKNNKASQYSIRGKNYNNCLYRKEFYIGKIKQIPKQIRMSTKRSICNFLSGLFDTDGGVEKQCVAITTKSSILASQLQSILLNLGILSKRRIKIGSIKSTGFIGKYHEISISNTNSLKIFKEEIGFKLQYKQESLEKLCYRKESPKNDLVFNVKNLLISLKTKAKDILPMLFCGRRNNMRDLLNSWIRKPNVRCRRDKLLELLNNWQVLENESEFIKIKQLCNPNYLFDTIKTIKTSKSYTSDYFIDNNNHSFVTNGMISHNCGKSYLAMNYGLNIAKQNIPVLYLDTELTKDYQQNRLVCIDSRCPLVDFETGNFQTSDNLTKQVIESGQLLKNLPLYYKSVSGMTHVEAMSVARRWLAKVVGFNDQGKANDCVIVYDYFKLMNQEQLNRVTPEYIMLGLMLTELHNFTVKYEIPMIGFVQLNRDGIDTEDTSVVAGSDRILWLASSLTLLKNKSEEDAALGCGWEFGNKKLVVLATRHGPGLESESDYINLHCGLRPNVSRTAANGFIKEGMTLGDALRTNKQQNQPADAGSNTSNSN